MTADPAVPGDVTAAELALSVLDGAEGAAALRRMLAEPDFAREVEAWRARLAPLFADVGEVAPPAGLQQRIEAVLDGSADPQAGVRRWRALAAIAFAVAACLLMFIAVRDTPPSVAKVRAVLIAEISPVSAGTPLPAVYDPGSGALRVGRGLARRASRSAQLWLIGGDGVPHALGLLAENAATRLELAPVDRARIAAGATLAVSIEPRGGSPTGQPTGPVVAKGILASV